MVGFTLAEITGNVIDTAEERVERMQEAFDKAVKAFGDLRFNDARDHIAEIKGEIDSTELFLEINGEHPNQNKGEGS